MIRNQAVPNPIGLLSNKFEFDAVEPCIVTQISNFWKFGFPFFIKNLNVVTCSIYNLFLPFHLCGKTAKGFLEFEPRSIRDSDRVRRPTDR